jgi:hypothetical protein
VADDVVQLAGDPGPLGVRRRRDRALALALLQPALFLAGSGEIPPTSPQLGQQAERGHGAAGRHRDQYPAHR